MSQLDQPPGVTAGSAGGVQGVAGRKLLEDRPHQRLLDRDQWVAGPVVGLGPSGVARLGVELWDVDAEGVPLAITADDAPDLLHAGCGRVVVAGEDVTHQPDPGDADEELPETD